MSRRQFDLLIIGAGQASVPLATALSEAGWQVAVAERNHLGGSCVNFGCIPTKAVLESAKLAHQARRAGDYGLKIPEVEVDFGAVLAGARALVESSRDSLQEKFEGGDAPTLLRGAAKVLGRGDGGFRVSVDDKECVARQLVLNTGTKTLIPDVGGLDDVDYLTAETWLEQTTLPEHVLILGGGYIGLEMSQFYRRMGARVTLLEEGGQVASHEDEDVAERLQRCLEAEGVEIHLGVTTKRVAETSAGVTLSLEKGGGALEVEGSHLLVATGRQPVTQNLGLEVIGVEVDDKGVVRADETLATSVEGVWVAGDVRGGPMFTHTAYDDYRVLESQLLGDGSHTAERVIPYAIFTDPQLGRVGMTERRADEAGKAYVTSTYNMKVNGRARAARHKEGCIKVVIEKETDKLLGAAVLAAEGAEMVHAYIALMNADAPYTAILNGLHVHPTYSEGLQSVFKDLPG